MTENKAQIRIDELCEVIDYHRKKYYLNKNTKFPDYPKLYR